MMCPGVFLTVELAAHPAVLAIIRTPALAIAKSLEYILTPCIERGARRSTFDNRTHLLSSMFHDVPKFFLRPAAKIHSVHPPDCQHCPTPHM
jgi:hypothetical protein